MSPQNKTVSLPSTGAPVTLDVSGKYFYCVNASAGRFEVSFDYGQSFVATRKGVQLGNPGVTFNHLSMRILSGTSTANQIEFIYSDDPIVDMRGIDADAQIATVYTRQSPFVLIPLLATGNTQVFPDNVDNIELFDGQSRPLRTIEWYFTNVSAGMTLSYGGNAIRRILANIAGDIDAPLYQLDVSANFSFELLAGGIPANVVGNVFATYWL